MLSKSKIQTQKLAVRFAKKILHFTLHTPHPKASIIALHGDLGAGKTTFIQGFMKALGVKQHITSPTFVIFRKYSIRVRGRAKSQKKKFLSPTLLARPYENAYHFDLYRIHKPKEILNLGFKKIISDPRNIILIEWPERIKKLLPKNTIWIYFEHGKNDKERIVKINNNL
ncbi:MAG: hypothetical protein A3I89_03930 [Candidatus Harrisonbacteria bacterium RIFCSPLOWO2_02_FULL_41_11]|uniref:tRNA threonylcarbamoyladenosine biosynthesis protein TsaE n=1 Tax=Candidatus Harrisonbacteria bacterium RIFCSPHIGHO2_02_FULL_42_16 TaxID=1798404 RepID=A0A1G1ZHS1_9BACT|nr:MAG: hypothetical protein A3B92_00985 [Candidatus Harrisonbacteria bacterium RIFCSPHIGHO2_02_FULL_42_16]OGY67130.1 MAG: hypothetical protein A3I89_03930 [Candidatus Harrisonbacteria bacterium RIFCSPLOWO2_02_FULL_41_11]